MGVVGVFGEWVSGWKGWGKKEGEGERRRGSVGGWVVLGEWSWGAWVGRWVLGG
jgi:hypothetical protein